MLPSQGTLAFWRSEADVCSLQGMAESPRKSPSLEGLLGI
jgi:hypothetical protein